MPFRRASFRRLALLTVAASAAFALAACSSGGPREGSPGDEGPATQADGVTLAEVQEAGTLVVATEGTYRPFTFAEGGSGDLTGYDIEIIEAVAEKLGVEIEYQETQWDAIFAGLDSGRSDVIANQVSINPEREERYLFSEPYTVSPGVLIVPEGSDITSFEQLEGRTSAQSLTSNWFEVAESFGAEVEAVEGWAQAAALVQQGRVDATVNDELTFLDAQKTGDAEGLSIAATSDDVSLNAFAFRKGSDDLVAAIDEALAELREEGKLAEISEKYFGADVSE